MGITRESFTVDIQEVLGRRKVSQEMCEGLRGSYPHIEWIVLTDDVVV